MEGFWLNSEKELDNFLTEKQLVSGTVKHNSSRIMVRHRDMRSHPKRRPTNNLSNKINTKINISIRVNRIRAAVVRIMILLNRP